MAVSGQAAQTPGGAEPQSGANEPLAAGQQRVAAVTLSADDRSFLEQAAKANPGPKAAMPVLMFHGLADTALGAGALNDTWQWLEKDLTLVTVPGASHWVQHDAADLVSETMRWWLAMRRE